MIDTVFSIMVIIANGALTFFAISAFMGLRRLERRIAGMERGVDITTALTMGEHVRRNFEEVNRMRETFQHLVETEQYEEAQELQGLIMKAEREAEASLKCFKATCGDKIADVVVTSVKTRGRKED